MTFAAPESLIPSIKLAWFRASEKTVSSGFKIEVSRPTFAAYPEPK